MGSAFGAAVGYLAVCVGYGEALPVLSVPTIVAVVIGGTIGQLFDGG